MLNAIAILAQDTWPWYNNVLIVAIVGILVGYKIYKNKTMS